MADRSVERIIKRDFAPTPGEKSCYRCDHTRICRWACGSKVLTSELMGGLKTIKMKRRLG